MLLPAPAKRGLICAGKRKASAEERDDFREAARAAADSSARTYLPLQTRSPLLTRGSLAVPARFGGV
ncbi:hypothetical protein PC128_g1642 [Phytophthora cactorum]|nr:hypothetical protein PC120_g965 [Phytophthora cactorum]KAG3205006.1 hypothetical protein PC128_g1642 [Phytophthora cactorum]KAG4059064.1 hypothetical protein PC123_g6018 [Phytophthora cactorum]